MEKYHITNIRKKTLIVYLALSSAGLVYYCFIKLTGFAIPCFYLATTGLRCGACGITHMFMALARLDIASAFACNPVTFILFILWNITGIMCMTGRFRLFADSRFHYTMLGITIASLVIWGILRNIP